MQLRTAQIEAQRASAQLAEAHTKHAAEMLKLEEELSGSKDAARHARGYNSTVSAENTTLKESLRQQAEQIKELVAEVKSLEKANSAIADRDRRTNAKYEAKVKSLTDSLKQFQAQLQQTQSLLSVVQDQRKNLQKVSLLLLRHSGSLGHSIPLTYPIPLGQRGSQRRDCEHLRCCKALWRRLGRDLRWPRIRAHSWQQLCIWIWRCRRPGRCKWQWWRRQRGCEQRRWRRERPRRK